MGIIIRQSFKASLVAYIGVVIGIVNQLFVSTKFLSTEQIALSRLLLENSLLFAAISHLGTPFIADKFFSRFRDESQKHQGFLVFLLLYPLLGLTLFSVLYTVFQPWIVSYFKSESPALLKYHHLTLPLTFFWAYISILEVYSRNHARITVPTLVREVYLKIANVLLIIIFAVGWINFQWLMYLIVASYGLGVVILILYIKNLKKLFIRYNSSFFKGTLFREFFFFGLFIVIGGVGQSIVLFIDRIMLAGERGLHSTGIFIVTSYIAGVIEIPKKTLTQISVPILSQALHGEDWPKVQELYLKTALNQMIIGCLIFLGIWCNIDELFSLVPKGDIYRQGKYVVLYICLAKLFDMSTGLNAEILLYSIYYRIITLFVIAMAILSVIANSIFIPAYGYIGAAWATALTTLVYCTSRVFFVWKRFHILPFNRKNVYTILIAGFTFFAIYFLPFSKESDLRGILFTLIARSLLIVSIFGFLILYFRVSPDINHLLLNLRMRLFSIKK